MDQGKIFITRHASTKLNSDGDAIRGWLDVPLDSKGRDETKVLAEKLAAEGVDAIITSDLVRAVETAEMISKASGAPILQKVFALRPWNVGSLQGHKFVEIKDELFHLMDNPSIEAPGGESFNGYKTRAFSFIHQLNNWRGKNLVVVSHHRFERLINAWQSAGGKRDDSIDINQMKVKGIEPGTYRTINYPNTTS